MEPAVGKLTAWAIGGPAWRIDFAVGFDDRELIVDFSNAESEIPDEFLEGFELFFSGFIAVEIANQTDPQSDVVEIIAMDMASVDLAMPAITNLDLAVS